MTGLRVDHLAHVVAVRQLAGRELPLHQRIACTCEAVDALQTSTRTWRAFAPRSSALEAAIAQTDAVARGLCELRGSLTPQQEDSDAVA